MRDYQQELNGLRARIAQRRENTSVLNELRRQETDQCREVEGRRARLRQEERDVERLERLTFSAVLAALRGNKDEQIDRERAEAYAARLRLREAERQLAEIQADIADRESRIQADAGCEAVYEALLREKEADLRRRDPALAAKLEDLERRELELTARRRELREALDAGEQALLQLDAALESLDSAEGWGTWDLLGGGLMTDVMKYSRLDEAQARLEDVKSSLRRYQTELADVAREAEFDVRSEGFLYVADVFFDSFFAGLAVQDQIGQSQRQLWDVKSRIQTLQGRLENDLGQADQNLEDLWTERDELVRQA